jgi:gliding motility-associated-like protein
VYVTGNTSSANYPTSAGAFQTVLKGYSDLIATKLNATGSTLVYSTLIGSSKNEYGVGIGVNAAGEATIGGNTDSLDFPTTAGAYDQTFNDAPNIYNLKGDMAVVKFNATGTGLVYSTFLGGNIGDNMQGFYLSSNDEAFVCGVILFSNNFPITPGVLGPTTANGTFDSFVTRFNTTGSALIYSTYMGNADQSSDEARDIWVNACDEAYVTGDGGSFATFPVTAPCATCTGGEDIYLCKLSPTAASFVWSTFVGSKGWDVCQAIGVYVGSTKEDVAIGFGSSHFTYPTTAGVFQQIKPIPNDSTTNIPGITKYSNPVSIGTANAGPDITICPGAVVTLTGNAGATAYSWNPGGQSTSSISVSPSSTTSYTLTVTNSCGTLQDSVKVTVSNSINAAIAGNTSICAGQSVTLTASGGGTYSWSTGATTAVVTIAPTASSSYSVIVGSGSCPADTAVVALTISSPPNASITGNSVVCGGQSTTLTASGGGTYSWNTGSSATSIVINPTSSANYTVTVNSGGCTAIATQSVSVLPGITLVASSTQTGCTVNNGTATGTPSGGTSPFTYSWSNGQSGPIASGLAAGNYTVTVTDAGGCSKTQTVTVTSNSTLNANATSTQTGCSAANGTASATASSGTAPYTYAWSNGSSSQAISGLAAGNYSVVITDANGCTKVATATVTAAPGPVATATATATTVTAGGNTTLSSTGGGTYSWSPSTGLSCTTCANPTATPDQTTEYCVVVTDANGCSDSACITIVIDVPCGNIYIPNAFSPNNDLENDLECVMGACIDSMHIIIFDRWGEKVFESSDQKICWDGNYKGKSLSTAVFSYYLEATMENKEKVIRKGNVSLVR